MSKKSDIIAPIDRDLIESELNDERFVRNTNKAGNKIYIINHHNSPNTMREIGRLRGYLETRQQASRPRTPTT